MLGMGTPESDVLKSISSTSSVIWTNYISSLGLSLLKSEMRTTSNEWQGHRHSSLVQEQSTHTALGLLSKNPHHTDHSSSLLQ